jgi:hypothetical protein
MNSFSACKASVLFVAVFGGATLGLFGGSAHAVQANAVNPFYIPTFTTSWGDETQYALPNNSPPTSVGYWFETDRDNIRVNALGFPAFLQRWDAFPANSYTVNLWKYDTSGYTQMATATFNYATPGPDGLNPNYTFKDGYYWQDVPVVNLGLKSNADPNVIFVTAAQGNYSANNGLPYLMGGTGTFAPGTVTWDSNGISSVASFPYPEDTILSPAYGIFNPNISYDVPAPLPLLGAGVALGCARRMRNRIRLASDRKSLSVGSNIV